MGFFAVAMEGLEAWWEALCNGLEKNTPFYRLGGPWLGQKCKAAHAQPPTFTPPHALGSALVEADSSRSCLKKWKSKSLREMTWHKLRDLAQTGVLVHTEAHGFGGEFVALPGTTHFRAKQGRNPNRSHKGVVFSP